MDIGGRRPESAGRDDGVFGVPILRTPGEFYLADIPRGTVLIVLPLRPYPRYAPLCNAPRGPLFYPLSSTYFTTAFFLLPRVSFASSRRYARHFHLALNC